MFIILLNYVKPLELVEKYLTQHREFLDYCYKNNFFIVSGPKNPRTGGIIISQLSNRAQIEELLKQDPFQTNHITEYELIEFNITKYHPEFSPFIEMQQ